MGDSSNDGSSAENTASDLFRVSNIAAVFGMGEEYMNTTTSCGLAEGEGKPGEENRLFCRSGFGVREGERVIPMQSPCDHPTRPRHGTALSPAPNPKLLLHAVQKRQGKEARSRIQRIAIRTKSDIEILDDGFKWRKYGQKAVKNCSFPRGYYKCANMNCCVKKQIQRCSEDSEYVITMYEGKHNHHSPGPHYHLLFHSNYYHQPIPQYLMENTMESYPGVVSSSPPSLCVSNVDHVFIWPPPMPPLTTYATIPNDGFSVVNPLPTIPSTNLEDGTNYTMMDSIREPHVSHENIEDQCLDPTWDTIDWRY